jgi:DNA helicase II / ATP-dependent DNA helicase PcrA
VIDFNEAPSKGNAFGSFKNALGGSPTKYLENLNEPQREAVEATEGPLIVIAGAGSGKTKMLTSRITHLMAAKNVPPSQILAVTFTNKAAQEMRERVTHALGGLVPYGGPEIGTFHSVCLKILRREQAATPFTSVFSIFDDSDQLTLLKRTVDKLGIDEKAFSPKAFQAAINRLKCDAVEPKELEPAPHDLFQRNLKRVYEQYQSDLFLNQAIDFGEIICMTYRLLRDFPEIRTKYQNRFKYIHVDEYQDTNRAQYLLLSTLAKRENGGFENICVVGDEDQSIYKWRGADIKNILDFELDYPAARLVKLEQNYRSTKTVLKGANQLIKNNKERKPKTLWTDNEEGESIIRAHLGDERGEAEFVVGEIKRRAASEGRALTDFAIFYRTHAQSRQFEEVFRRERIPYDIYGGLRFYDRKEIKDVLAYFKLILNPSDSISLKRVINTPARGIGKSTIESLEALQSELEMNPLLDSPASLWTAVCLATDGQSSLGSGPTKKLKVFREFMETMTQLQKELPLTEFYHRLLDATRYVVELRAEGTDEAMGRIENLEEFNTVLQEFEENHKEKGTEAIEHLSLFLEEASLATNLTDAGKKFQESSVLMMSLHSSKGLEYPVVFMVGLEDGLFPSERGWEEGDEEEMEEERRLCYVGMTRARKTLYMTHAQIRRIWGQVHYQEPSRFFQEIPSDLVDFRDMSRQQSSYSSYHGGSSRGIFAIPVSSSGLIGKRLRHPDYGPGKITSEEGEGKDQKVTIRFSTGSEKKFLYRFVERFVDGAIDD